MIIVVTGSRHLSSRAPILDALQRYRQREVELHHGGCGGADILAAELAREWGWTVVEHPAEWERYGKVAGPIRNAAMVTEALRLSVTSGRELLCVALPAPMSRGTRQCMAVARAMGIKVMEYGVST